MVGKVILNKLYIKYLNLICFVNNLVVFFDVFRYLCCEKLEVFVCLLWWVSFLLILYYVFRFFSWDKNLKMVVFVYSFRFVYFVDFFFIYLVFMFVCEIWCDLNFIKNVIILKFFLGKLKVVFFFFWVSIEIGRSGGV